MGKKYVIFFWCVLSLVQPLHSEDLRVSPDKDTQLLMSKVYGQLNLPSYRTHSEVLWTYDADDNASCIRSIPDVNGDSIPDAIVGHDIFQDNHNFFCFSGASSVTGTVIWSLETTGGASGGYFWGDECISPGSDADDNGYPNVLAGLAGGGRFAAAYDGLDGALIWQFDTYTQPESGWVYSICELGDVSGDSIADVIFGCGSYNDHAYCIDGSSTGTTPTVLWSLALPDASFSVARINDVNSDGLPDALISAGDSDGHHVYCVEGDSHLNAHVLWTYDAISSAHSITAFSDSNGNGAQDFAVATWGSGIRCGDGITGGELWYNDLGGTYCMMVRPFGDITQDGVDELVVGTFDNAVYCLNGKTGSVEWSTPTGTLNGGDVWTVSGTSDIDNDGFSDVLAGSFDTLIYCLSGIDGEILVDYQTNNRVFSVYPIGDVNNDAVPDVLAGTQDTTHYTLIYCLKSPVIIVPTISIFSGLVLLILCSLVLLKNRF